VAIRIAPYNQDAPGPLRWEVDVRGKTFATRAKFRERRIIEGSKTYARSWAERKLRELASEDGTVPDPEPKKETRVLTVAEWAPKMDRYYQDAKASARDTSLGIIATHIVPHIGTLPLDRVTDGAKDDLEATWRRGGYLEVNTRGRTIKPTGSKKTLNNRRMALASLLKYAVTCSEESGLTALHCTIKLVKVDGQKVPKFYEVDVAATLVKAAARMEDPRALVIMLLGADCGLRGGELMGLEWRDVNFRTRRITIARNIYERRAGDHIVDDVKGGLEKPIPMSDRLIKALKKLPAKHARVLVDKENTPVTWRQLTWIIERIERAAGFPKKPKTGPLPAGVMHFQGGATHILKHTFLSHLAMAGVPARTAQEMGRHADLATTMRYMHLAKDAKEDAAKALAKLRK